jgi:GT2 family glycosyltransferase
MSAGPPPRLSVVVPATNSPPTLERCRAAIERGLGPADELIVVESAANPGPAAARNRGARRAGGDALVFVDADVVIHPDALGRIREIFAADPGLTALFGSYDDSPEAPGAVSGFRNLLHHHVHQSAPGPAATFWAGLGAVRRQAFEDVGGFDERTYPRPSIEDIELGARLRGRGGRIELHPELQGTHLKRWTLLDMVRTDFARRGAPWVALLAQSQRQGAGGAPPTGLNLGWRHRLSALAVVVFVLMLLRRRPLAALAALAAMVGLNRSLYALILRRRGPGEAVAAVGLHAIHHLTAAASVPAGLAGSGGPLAPTPAVPPDLEWPEPVAIDEPAPRPR